MAFEKIVGNEQNKRILQEAIKSKHILHSYLFVGNSGIGKYLFAKEFAKMILCLDLKETTCPCNKCKSCTEWEHNNNPDFKVINPEGSTIKVEQIRGMIGKIIEKPIIGDRKVYIINDSDTMTIEAQNTLLKTLEEPPEYITIILVAEKEGKILNTIKSRCSKIAFQPIEQKKLKEILETEYGFKDFSSNLLEFFQGSIERALKVKEKKEEYEAIEKIIFNLETISQIEMINNQNAIYQNKEDIFFILDYCNMLFWKIARENTALIGKCMKSITSVEEAKKRLQANSNFDMTIDNMLLEIWEEWNEEYHRS